LRGTYAHLAVAELWRVRATQMPDRAAADRCRTYRSWVVYAIDMILAAGCLLPAGERLSRECSPR
jgi:uncharacterized protein